MDQIRTGSLIRRLRLEQGMTQLALAERLGVSDKAVSKWERGCGALRSLTGCAIPGANQLQFSHHAKEAEAMKLEPFVPIGEKPHFITAEQTGGNRFPNTTQRHV